jgi:hypothetical protein
MLVACAFHVEYTFSYRFLATSALKEIDQPRGPSLPYGTLFKFHFRRKHAILQFAAWGLTVIAVTVITATFIAVTFIAVAFVAVTFIAGDFHCTDFQRSVTRKYRLLNFLWLYKLYIYILYRMVWALLEKTPRQNCQYCVYQYIPLWTWPHWDQLVLSLVGPRSTICTPSPYGYLTVCQNVFSWADKIVIPCVPLLVWCLKPWLI